MAVRSSQTVAQSVMYDPIKGPFASKTAVVTTIPKTTIVIIIIIISNINHH